MTTDFDLVINRRNTNNLNKWTTYPKDVLPMWVADMDFRSPKPILDELRKAVDHGVFGYELPPASLKETVAHVWTGYTAGRSSRKRLLR